MGISLEGTWKVILTDGTAAQMHLPGTLDESGIGHRDVGANQWHPDAALGNAEVLQNWCRSVPEDGSTSSWRVKQNWVRLRLFQGTGPGDHQSAGNPMRDREILREDLLP